MTECDRARQTFALYMSRAATAQEKATRTVGNRREQWIAATNLWLGMAKDLREVWKDAAWARE